MKNTFLPKSIVVLKEGYSLDLFSKDLIAGIIVGIVALPLSIALAIASGVSPERGLFTAIIGGFFISLLGGSRVQIGGPTGAFVVIIYAIIQQYGYEGLTVACIIAGVLLIIFGLFKLGNIIKYIPYPVTIGFTSGIALLIFTSQIKDFLGLNIENMPAEFIHKIKAISNSLNTININALSIGLLTILISIIWSKKFKKIPGSLIAIIITTLLVNLGWGRFGLPDYILMILILLIATSIGVLRLFKDKRYSYGLVFIWAYTGILIKHISPSGFAGRYIQVIITTSICILVFLISETIIYVKGKKNEVISKNPEIKNVL